jgi:hypothetical protein
LLPPKSMPRRKLIPDQVYARQYRTSNSRVQVHD